MSELAGLLHALSLIAVFIAPFVYMRAMRNIRDNKATGIHELILGVCGVVVLLLLFNSGLLWL